MSKSYRVYFNRCEDTPQVWSVDEGTTASEINVLGVVVKVAGAMITRQNLEAVYPEPKAWFEAEGQLAIQYGVAVIE